MRSAVLFLVFNRPDTTRQVFEAIRKAQPPRLYIAADGPRSDKAGEQKKCDEVRRIATAVDWDCEVKTLFREKNLGCKMGVSGGIDWFFEYEEEGIILEDDCLPAQSFFSFCDELLPLYRNDMRVWQLSGNNQLNGWINDKDYSYYFASGHGSIWGWATWRDRWDRYSVDMHCYDEVLRKECLGGAVCDKLLLEQRISQFALIKQGLDTWDYQWLFVKMINSGLSLIPNKNLIHNVGFSECATHTKSRKDIRLDFMSGDLDFPLKHPPYVVKDLKAERKHSALYLSSDVLGQTVKKLKLMVKKFTHLCLW